MPDAQHAGAAAFETPVRTVITAVVGLVAVAVSLLVLVLDLLVTPEVGALIISFVVCGAGATAGFMLLRRLPRREPITLFAGPSESVSSTRQEVFSTPTEVSAQVSLCPQYAARTASGAAFGNDVASIHQSHPQKSVSRYKAQDGIGALGLICIVGVCLILGGRLNGGWEFLSFVVPAGCLVALLLDRGRRWQKDSGISRYTIPVSGGIVGSAALAGVGMVMARFHFLRDFLGLAIAAGCAIALALQWGRRRRQSSIDSVVQADASESSFSR